MRNAQNIKKKNSKNSLLAFQDNGSPCNAAVRFTERCLPMHWKMGHMNECSCHRCTTSSCALSGANKWIGLKETTCVLACCFCTRCFSASNTNSACWTTNASQGRCSKDGTQLGNRKGPHRERVVCQTVEGRREEANQMGIHAQ